MNTLESRTSELMTREEAAQYLRLAPGTLSNWQSTQRQKIPSLKLGKRVFYRKNDLDKWIELKIINRIE